MKPEDIKEILESHKKWLIGDGGSRADLRGANLRGANLRGADLCDADLCDANLRDANLRDVINMIKLMGIGLGNRYYKAIGGDFCNEGYAFTVGLNVLRNGEKFASDERVSCSYPGFHFASELWCRREYGNRPYMCLIRIPTKEEYDSIEINEPWATDGKASASAIIIEKVFDMKTNEDLTEMFADWADGKGNKNTSAAKTI